MDVNGTRFQLIQGQADWSACREGGLPGPWVDAFWDDPGGYVTLTPLLPVVRPPRLGGPLDPSLRRGAAADRLGHWYWIGLDRHAIYWLPRGTQQVLTLWPRPTAAAPAPAGGFAASAAPLPAVLEFGGLAVTSHNYLVAGSLAPPGLLIFDLEAGAPPFLLTLPQAVPFAPFDMAPAADGGCWVLDRQNRTYWGLDRFFHAVAQTAADAPAPSAFSPVDGADPAPAPEPVPAGFAVAVPDPIAIEGLPDGSVLLLDGSAATAPEDDDTSASSVYRYRSGTQLGPALPLRGAADVYDASTSGLRQITLAVVAHDIAYDPDAGVLYAADRFGRQSLAFRLALTPAAALALQPSYLPMHLFGGRGIAAWRDGGTTAVAYDVVGNAAALDQGVRWARLLEIDQPACARDAVLETPVFDGKARDCVWDGLFLDACIPPGASVSITSYADNDPELAADPQAPFRSEPALHLRPAGAEIPYYDPFLGRPAQPDRLGTWEALLQQARGRYLKVRLELSGNGRAAPQLQALRVYYPRFSYARRYLPAVYVEEPVSASFVERLLANPKGFYTDIEGKIRDVGVLFDPRSAPADALDWLAGWLGLTLDPLWQDINQRLQTAGSTAPQPVADRRRLLIRFATRLFRRRGTADGIRFALHLLLEPCLEATLRRFRLAALNPDPALVEQLQSLGLPVPAPSMCEDDIEDLLTAFLLSPQRPSKIRIVERFMARGPLALAAGDPTETGSPADSAVAAAHRFAVLVPETLSVDVTAMVSRIVDLEKPAHTAYEVRRYWDYFRVGEARLGIDTILGEDARFLPVVLGQNALSQGYLAYPPPTNAGDRVVLGRDRIGSTPVL